VTAWADQTGKVSRNRGILFFSIRK
jgi:hypothetical protein